MGYRLTLEIEDRVIHFIRAGGFDWVAAEAAGVPRPVFERWLARGEQSGRQPYHRFYVAVMQARAQARLKAEVELRGESPRDWLRLGPGREQPDQPGWTSPARPQARPKCAGSLLDSPEFQRIARDCLDALTPFPEARLALGDAMGRKEKRRWHED
jgi:hypothetical protein